MDDDDIFEDSMASMGVEPLDRERARRARRRRDDAMRSDRRLFESAMQDRGGEERRREERRRGERRREERRGGDGRGSGDRGRRARRPSVRKVRARAKHLRIDEQLDLHRLKSEEAVVRLERFVATSAAAGEHTVLVITGKGVHSPGGRSVLKQRLEEWIRGRGRDHVRAYSEAPRTLGGGGAYVLFLRSAD